MAIMKTEMNVAANSWTTKPRRPSFRGFPKLAILLGALMLFSGCNRGLRYERAKVETPPAYKEIEGWKQLNRRTTRFVASGGRCSTSPS